MKRIFGRVFPPDLLFFALALTGALFGALTAALFQEQVEVSLFAGGFAHGVPGSFSVKALALAVLFQALPMALIYYAAFGVLVRHTAGAVLFLRSFLCGYCLVTAARMGDLSEPLFLALWILFLLFELLTLSFHASFAHLASAFSSVILKKRSKRAVKRFTGDFLFFYGLILFFYIARGVTVALMNL